MACCPFQIRKNWGVITIGPLETPLGLPTGTIECILDYMWRERRKDGQQRRTIGNVETARIVVLEWSHYSLRTIPQLIIVPHFREMRYAEVRNGCISFLRIVIRLASNSIQRTDMNHAYTSSTDNHPSTQNHRYRCPLSSVSLTISKMVLEIGIPSIGYESRYKTITGCQNRHLGLYSFI